MPYDVNGNWMWWIIPNPQFDKGNKAKQGSTNHIARRPGQGTNEQKSVRGLVPFLVGQVSSIDNT